MHTRAYPFGFVPKLLRIGPFKFIKKDHKVHLRAYIMPSLPRFSIFVTIYPVLMAFLFLFILINVFSLPIYLNSQFCGKWILTHLLANNLSSWRKQIQIYYTYPEKFARKRKVLQRRSNASVFVWERHQDSSLKR